jgi:hypothetical protein
LHGGRAGNRQAAHGRQPVAWLNRKSAVLQWHTPVGTVKTGLKEQSMRALSQRQYRHTLKLPLVVWVASWRLCRAGSKSPPRQRTSSTGAMKGGGPTGLAASERSNRRTRPAS